MWPPEKRQSQAMARHQKKKYKEGNKVSVEGACALSKALIGDSTLESLNLWSVHHKQDDSKQVAQHQQQ